VREKSRRQQSAVAFDGFTALDRMQGMLVIAKAEVGNCVSSKL